MILCSIICNSLMHVSWWWWCTSRESNSLKSEWFWCGENKVLKWITLRYFKHVKLPLTSLWKIDMLHKKKHSSLCALREYGIFHLNHYRGLWLLKVYFNCSGMNSAIAWEPALWCQYQGPRQPRGRKVASASLRLTRRPTRVLIITTSRGISFGWMKSPKMILEEGGWGGQRAAFSKSSYLATQFASAGCLRLKSQVPQYSGGR